MDTLLGGIIVFAIIGSVVFRYCVAFAKLLGLACVGFIFMVIFGGL